MTQSTIGHRRAHDGAGSTECRRRGRAARRTVPRERLDGQLDGPGAAGRGCTSRESAARERPDGRRAADALALEATHSSSAKANAVERVLECVKARSAISALEQHAEAEGEAAVSGRKTTPGSAKPAHQPTPSPRQAPHSEAAARGRTPTRAAEGCQRHHRDAEPVRHRHAEDDGDSARRAPRPGLRARRPRDRRDRLGLDGQRPGRRVDAVETPRVERVDEEGLGPRAFTIRRRPARSPGTGAPGRTPAREIGRVEAQIGVRRSVATREPDGIARREGRGVMQVIQNAADHEEEAAHRDTRIPA